MRDGFSTLEVNFPKIGSTYFNSRTCLLHGGEVRTNLLYGKSQLSQCSFSVLAAFKIGITFLMGILSQNMNQSSYFVVVVCMFVRQMSVTVITIINVCCLWLTINLQSSERHFNKKSEFYNQPTVNQAALWKYNSEN